MLVDMYQVSCLDLSVTEDIAGALKRIQEGFEGTYGCLGQRLLRDLEQEGRFMVVSYWRDKERSSSASALHAAIDEALDLLKAKSTANVYEIIHDL
jgi:quinol monooxygenase YgiN